MKNTYIRTLPIFFFFICLIEKVLSQPELILNKHFSIRTKNNYFIFNIADFLYNEDIYLTIKSESKCEDIIYYQFYDNIENISMPNTDFKFKADAYIKEKKNLIKDDEGISLYFSITKRKDILFNKKGNLLYFEFNCGSEVEIINTKDKHENIISVFLYYVSVFLLLTICLIVIKSIICSLIIITKNSNYIKRSWNDNTTREYSNNQNGLNIPKERIVYIVQDRNMINVNENEKNNNGNYVLNINNENNLRGNDVNEYPELSQNISPEASQSTKILNSTNANFFTP